MDSRAPWPTLYSLGWVLALAPTGAIVAFTVVWMVPGIDENWWWAGVLVGLVGGLLVGANTRACAGLHGVARVAGPIAVFVGLVAAAALFALSLDRRGTETLLGGLVEFLMSMLAAAVALAGAGLWLAGNSGRHLARTADPAGTAVAG